MGTVVTRATPAVVHDRPVVVVEAEADGGDVPTVGRGWYESLAFEGPLDPAGTLFAFALSVAATVGLVVLVAAAVRVLTGS